MGIAKERGEASPYNCNTHDDRSGVSKEGTKQVTQLRGGLDRDMVGVKDDGADKDNGSGDQNDR